MKKKYHQEAESAQGLEIRTDSTDELYYTVDHIDKNTLNRINRKKGFTYGYNEEYDFVCISNDGTVGEFYNIQGLVVGIPLPSNIHNRNKKDKTKQYWERLPVPQEKATMKISNWQEYLRKPELHKELDSYIDTEFNRRYDGFWFMNNGIPTYITGTNYFFLQWANIDSDTGWADYRDCNRIFHYFWEACKADERSYGMIYLKNRRSGFSFMAGSETVHTATMTRDRNFGILSKTGSDAKEFFMNKTVRISRKLPFFFRPVQSGTDNPKTILEYKSPAVKLTRKSYLEESELEVLDSLDTTIEWKNTGSNAFDGFKLKLLVHDESAKWEKPHDLAKNWGVTKTCLRVGARVVGKCMMGSTCNRLDSGGQEFKDIYEQSNLLTSGRNANGQTSTGLYSLFIPMQYNYQSFIDRYGFAVLRTPKNPVEGVDGVMIKQGILDYWEGEVDGLRNNSDALNEFYRQNPKVESHAFRDKADKSLFNLVRIYEQKEHNEELGNKLGVTIGNFQWEDGARDESVKFYPNKDGRFRLGWVPPVAMQNNVLRKNGLFYPGNSEFGAFGCDSYDVSGVVYGNGSNGALHGMTSYNLHPDVPPSEFFLEYVARPQTAEIFFEDILMACFFYGMPMLAENNKIRLLAHFKKRGYRSFSMNRPDKLRGKLRGPELEFGGIPNTSDDVKQAHAASIETYIEEHIGYNESTDEMNFFPFNRTLTDWVHFDITNRTKYDASISSGLAIMANRRHHLYPKSKEKKNTIILPFREYDNSGRTSSILNKH